MPPKLSNDRALRIVVAAREEVARGGLAGARVEQIARRAGVNKQLLFYYYHSKHGLFQAALAEAAAELEAALSNVGLPSGVPLERLRLALQAQFEFLALHPQLVALLAQATRLGGSGRRVGFAPFAPAAQRRGVLL